MMAYKSLLSLAAVQAVSAHFGLVFPEWRADTLIEENEDRFSQWTYPCAGVDYKEGNVTDWPLEGGALKLDLHHPWTYVFVNLGLGENSTNFNISLTPQVLNATNEGILCIDELTLPSDIEVSDGDVGSIQVITVGDAGSALYNCADIRFKKNAEGPKNCSSEVDYFAVKDQNGAENDTESSSGNSSDSDSQQEGGNDDNAAGMLGVNRVALTSVVGLAAAFVMGFGL
ncbi:hypothetical protein FZEAL_7584 [Fusarium zealandicum]|uniref:Copper acquisition factor BIM1-like domain-containing protein n=1 Tax=Fusarium zealandicum TaxID=1053134 RepID=A0A8H4UFU8_9HYPO|nr:hypothetical protein FZEAL_7584 [Fusarium zealandicum]